MPLILMMVLLIPSVAVRANDEEYFPLAKGNERIAEITTRLPDGTSETAKVHGTVVEAVERDGRTYWRVKNEISGDMQSTWTVLNRRDDSGVYVVFEQFADAKEQRAIVFPLTVGSTWEFNNANKMNRVTVAGFENVTVGNRTYQKCVHLHMESEDGKIYERWSAPNVGEVKAEVTYPNGSKSLMTLKEFKPGK